MAREGIGILDNGDSFPAMEFKDTDGNLIRLPGDLVGKWSIVIFYRGHF